MIRCHFSVNVRPLWKLVLCLRKYVELRRIIWNFGQISKSIDRQGGPVPPFLLLINETNQQYFPRNLLTQTLPVQTLEFQTICYQSHKNDRIAKPYKDSKRFVWHCFRNGFQIFSLQTFLFLLSTTINKSSIIFKSHLQNVAILQNSHYFLPGSFYMVGFLV